MDIDLDYLNVDPPDIILVAADESEYINVLLPVDHESDIDDEAEDEALELPENEAAAAEDDEEKVDQNIPRNNSSTNESSSDEGEICPICLEVWTNSNEHRLVSLRCGHLFGRSCITRWLKGQARCPQCNARSRKSEIRNIYARTIKVVDTHERDHAFRELEKERELRRKAEIELTQEKIKNSVMQEECERIKIELINTHKILQSIRYSQKYDHAKEDTEVHMFNLIKSIEITKEGGCRIIDSCELLETIIVSQTVKGLFSGYGFRKISAVDMRPTEFVYLHSKQIKDMAFHKHDGLILTASLDKSVKITNFLGNSVVQNHTLESDVWSCTWDEDDPVYFYAGDKNGRVFQFDLRVNNRCLAELPCLGSNSPVVSMQYLRKLATSQNSKCGPIFGKFSDCGFYQKQPSGGFSGDVLPLTGPFTSLCSEPNTGSVLISCRPSAKKPRITHTLCDFEATGQVSSFRPIQIISGGSTQVQLSRSKLFQHPTNESSLLICAGDEDSHGALVWDSSTGSCVDQLKTESPVLDIASLKINHKFFLSSLTDKNLHLYNLSKY